MGVLILVVKRHFRTRNLKRASRQIADSKPSCWTALRCAVCSSDVNQSGASATNALFVGKSRLFDPHKSKKGATGYDTANLELPLWPLKACSSRLPFFFIFQRGLGRAFYF